MQTDKEVCNLWLPQYLKKGERDSIASGAFRAKSHGKKQKTKKWDDFVKLKHTFRGNH